MILIANAAVKKKNSFFKSKYNKLILQLGSRNKARVAIANRIARVVYHILENPGERYRPLNPNRVDSTEQQITRTIKKLKQLGVSVNYHHEIKVAEAKRTYGMNP